MTGDGPAGHGGNEHGGDEHDEPSGLDGIFHDSNFVEYEPEPLIPLALAKERVVAALRPTDSLAPTELITAAPAVADPAQVDTSLVDSSPPSAALSSTQRTLFWVAGAVIAAILLVILFMIGTRLAPQSAPVASTSTAKPSQRPSAVTASPSPTATSAAPVADPAVAGPSAAVGLHKFTELQGGECLSPYSSPWDETFTVVDCATPHAAQLVYRADFPAPVTKVWPGDAALASQINVLCTAPGVLNLAVAGTFNDIQFQGSYAASAAEWSAGNHSYSCFISRSSGQPLTGSVAAAR